MIFDKYDDENLRQQLIHPAAINYLSISGSDCKFNSFKKWVREGVHNETSTTDNYLIELESHPIFHCNKNKILFFKKKDSKFIEVETSTGYKNTTDYKIMKTSPGIGHITGMIYKLQLYYAIPNTTAHRTIISYL